MLHLHDLSPPELPRAARKVRPPRRSAGSAAERAQEGLKSNGNQWVNLRRLYESHEEQDVTAVINGTSERQMRNQFHAWSKFMTMDMDKRVEAAE